MAWKFTNKNFKNIEELFKKYKFFNFTPVIDIDSRSLLRENTISILATKNNLYIVKKENNDILLMPVYDQFINTTRTKDKIYEEIELLEITKIENINCLQRENINLFFYKKTVFTI